MAQYLPKTAITTEDIIIAHTLITTVTTMMTMTITSAQEEIINAGQNAVINIKAVTAHIISGTATEIGTMTTGKIIGIPKHIEI